MKYLQISNDGVCDPIGFTTLGVSTSREDGNKIGQFGSGNKLSALVLLRNNINPIIYCGETKIHFFTKSATMKYTGGEQQFEQVYVQIGNTTEKLSISLDFGKLDWTDVAYAVREIISNALDQSNQDISKIEIKIVDEIEPHPDKTVVGIPLTDEVRDYYEDLDKNFLHFSRVSSYEDKILPKINMGSARIYRKGVFVKTILTKLPSMFDYNFGDELKIDESRTLDSYSCEIDVVDRLTKSDKIGEIFETLVQGTQCWETSFTNWRVESVRNHDTKELWKKEWKKRFGDAIIAMDQQGPLVISARQKGYTVHIIDSIPWYKGMYSAGIPTVISVLDNVNDQGHVILPPNQNTIKAYKKVWKWLEESELTMNKERPVVKCFRAVQTDESHIFGYFKDNTVYINEDNSDSEQTMLEELTHYITGASDNTRPFQTFAFQISVVLANKLDETKRKLKTLKEFV